MRDDVCLLLYLCDQEVEWLLCSVPESVVRGGWIVRFDSSICYFANFDIEVVEFDICRSAGDLTGAVCNSVYIDAI